MSNKYISINTENPIGNYVRMYDLVVVDMSGVNSNNEIGVRPAIVIQNNKANFHGSNTIVILGTSQIKKEYLPCNFVLKAGEFGLAKDTLFNATAIYRINKNKIINYIGSIDDANTKKIILNAYMSNVLDNNPTTSPIE